MKKLIFLLLTIAAIGCITTKHERPCYYEVTHDCNTDTIFTDEVVIIGGGIGDQTDTYLFYLYGEQTVRISAADVMLRKL